MSPPPKVSQKVDPLICPGGRLHFVLKRVVSFVVILMRFQDGLRGSSHNTDAQNIAWLLQLVVTPPSSEPDGVQGSRVELRPLRGLAPLDRLSRSPALRAGRVKSRRPDSL